MIVCVVFATYGLYLKGLHYNSSNFFAGIRALSVATLNGEEDTFQAPLYIKISTILAQYSLIVLLSIWHKKKNYMPYIFFVVVVFAFFLFRSNKTVIAQLMLALLCFYMFYNKLSKKVLLLFLSLLVVLIFASHLLRSDNSTSFDIIDFLSVYLLSPLPAFDSVLNSTANYIYSFNGEFTFRFLIPFFQTIGFDVIENPDAFNIHNWTYTPVPVNVYTIMFGFYVDFGYSGIFIFSCVLGLLFGVIYKLSIQGYTICRIWYSITFYILVFQFFSDNLFLFLESHIGKFLFSILIFVSINNKNGRHINNHSQL